METEHDNASLGHQLLTAIRLQDVERVRALLAAGADPNTREPARRYVYHYGYMPTDEDTALTLACNAITDERIAIVRMLVDCGADPAARNARGLDAAQVAEHTRKVAARRRRAGWLRENVDLVTMLTNAVRAIRPPIAIATRR